MKMRMIERGEGVGAIKKDYLAEAVSKQLSL